MWIIYDTVAKKEYVDVKYATEQKAKRELADLLRPYPPGHEWRNRLLVKEAAPAVESRHAGQKS